MSGLMNILYKQQVLPNYLNNKSEGDNLEGA